MKHKLHLHFRWQKNAYANVDNADNNQRAPSPSLSPLFLPFYLSLCVSLLRLLPV